MAKDNSENIALKSQQALDDSIDNLSPQVLSELRNRRQQALVKSTNIPVVWWAPATAMAAVFSWFLLVEQPVDQVPMLALDDSQLLELSSEDPDMLADIEFVYWLSQQDEQI